MQNKMNLYFLIIVKEKFKKNVNKISLLLSNRKK